MSTTQQQLWSLGLVLSLALLAVANPVTSDSESQASQQPVRSNLFDKSPMQRYRWAFQQPSDEVLNSLRDRILLIRPVSRYPFTRKRSCFINAGLNNNCDFKDFISASSARRIWQSPNSPGKRSGAPAGLMVPATPDLSPYFYYPSLVGASDPDVSIQGQQAAAVPVKRMQCISGLPGGDCENSFLGGESLGQDFLRPGGRNPGRR